MPNHKFYFVANLIHFFGILKYIKRQQLTSITIYYEKLLFPRFFQKIQFVKFQFTQKSPRTTLMGSPRIIDSLILFLYQEC